MCEQKMHHPAATLKKEWENEIGHKNEREGEKEREKE